MYVPWFAEFMKVTPLAPIDWVIMISGAIFLFVVMKALKPVFNKLTNTEAGGY